LTVAKIGQHLDSPVPDFLHIVGGQRQVTDLIKFAVGQSTFMPAQYGKIQEWKLEELSMHSGPSNKLGVKQTPVVALVAHECAVYKYQTHLKSFQAGT
jgi:hypothetical protein